MFLFFILAFVSHQRQQYPACEAFVVPNFLRPNKLLFQQQLLQQPRHTTTSSSSRLYGMVIDPPSKKGGSIEGEEQKNATTDEGLSWKAVDGGFIPNISKQIRLFRQKRKERKLLQKQQQQQQQQEEEQQQLQRSTTPLDSNIYSSSSTSSSIDTDVKSTTATTATDDNNTYLGGVLQVTDIMQYKKEIVDVDDRIVAVRFYARKFNCYGSWTLLF
jgi:hypothetical protein